MHSTRFKRRGGILAAALICLLVIMMFSGAVARSVALRQRTAWMDQRQTQCFWLAESAASKATLKCRRDAAYTGETWQVAMSDRGQPANGVAEIRVEPVPDQPEMRRVFVEARWPDDPVHRIVRKRDFRIHISSLGNTQ